MRSLIMTKKNRGSNLVNWRTPARIGNQFDLSWPILTRCWRLLRKAVHKFNKMGGGMFRSWSLQISMLLSIRSKAFEKSIRHAVIGGLVIRGLVLAAWSHS